MSNIIEQVITWAVSLIDKFGYFGIFLTMMLESAAIPIPSEVVLPFSGFLSSTGRFSFWLVVLLATFANLVGSLIIYFVGRSGGRWLLENYGRYILIRREEVSKMDRWLSIYGNKTAFFSRLLPGVRTFSSLIIGAGKVNLNYFLFYTILGSFIWNLLLAYVGFTAGKNWDFLRPYFHKFEIVIGAIVLVGVVYFIIKHTSKFKK